MEFQLRKDFFTQLSLVILVLLFLEFIYPLQELKIIGEVHFFIGFILLIAAIKLFFFFPFLIRFLIGLVYIVYSIKTVYFSMSPNFFKDLKNQLVNDTFLLLGLEISNISYVTQTLLLFIFFWLVAGVIFERLIQKDFIVLFFILTIIYLASMDTFTLFEGEIAIIRVLVISFFYFGLRTLVQNVRFTKIDFRSIFVKKWLAMMMLSIVLGVGLGWFVPKLGPQLPDPLPFLNAIIKGSDGMSGEAPTGYVKEVGLGENDTILGGPLVGNNEVVFQAVTKNRSIGYFRVESKDYYTGKGWITTNELVNPPTNQFVQLAPLVEEGTVELIETEVSYRVMKDINYFPYQNFTIQLYGASLDYDFSQIGSSFNRLRNSFDIDIFNNTFYRVKMERAVLRNAPKPSSQIRDAYTQLPETLPQEVIDLAEEITSGISNDFDKVVAIENYLKSSIFAYDTVNVPYASKDKDYVYEFLFETRRGYCVNFSTAMVVLLRAIDIPSNWVKGYTQGNIIDTTSAGEYIFEITNDEAHAWVEVYFEGVGWIPFDPTVGFNTNIEFVNHIYTTEELLNNPNPDPFTPEAPKPEIQEENKPSTSGKKDPIFSQTVILTILITIFIIQAILLYIYRLKWLPYYYIWRVERYRQENVPDRALHYLFIHLKRLGFEKNSEETLNEFFERMDDNWKYIDFKPLVQQYTKWLYMKENSNVSEEIIPVWKEIMKKMSDLG